MPGPTGRWIESSVAGETVRAFSPAYLPPAGLKVESFYPLIDRANQALGRLDGLSRLLPNTSLFLYLYVQKEALLSSQIEGTQSSLSDLLLYESHAAPTSAISDVEEVSNYVAAVNHGLRRIREDDFPMSLRLICEMHAILLRGGRGANAQPGEFRRSQNWIGGTRPGTAAFVPPPAHLLDPLLVDLERFIHAEGDGLPRLVRIALTHVQFETIHPFLDGNGRLGRLLITLLLCADGALDQPILYLSLYFKTYRSTYYDLLQRVQLNGEWGEWLVFFLEGVIEVARQAGGAARSILDLFAADRTTIQTLGRRASAALRVHEHFQRNPVSDIPRAVAATNLTYPTVSGAVSELERAGILREMTGRARDRVFAYSAYMAILSEGAEPLPV
jgi:Fic family protein